MKDRFSTLSDVELVARIKKGDRGAFAVVYDRYSEVLYRLLLRKAETRDDARDILHDVFERVWTQRKALSDDMMLFPYLFRAVQNRSLDLIRQQITRRKYVDSFQIYIANQQDHQKLHAALEIKDLMAVIGKELETLPPNTRKIMEMRIIDGFTNKEIAALLEVSEDAIKSHYKRGISILKDRKELWLLILLLH